jgi:hypothetical protein
MKIYNINMTKGMKWMLLLSTLILFSCNNFLDEDPPSGTIIEENAFENFEDVQSALIGAYRFSTYNFFVVALNAWASDEAQRSRDNGGIGTIYFNWSFNSPIVQKWKPSIYDATD